MDAFEKIKSLLSEIETSALNNAELLEKFRIRFLGTKNIIKPLFGEMKNIPNDKKKEYGQALNQLKQSAEEKYNLLKLSLIHI